jgi:hypothetical protein
MAGKGKETPTRDEVENFVRVTGGGKGYYYSNLKSENAEKCFNQIERCNLPSKVDVKLHENQGLGFGRIQFPEDKDPKPYIRVPWISKESKTSNVANVSTDPRLLLHFVERVWGLERPNLVVSITGGAQDMKNTDDLQLVLLDLVSFARNTSAWLTTGGTHGGIMKLIGEILALLCVHIGA